MVPAKKKPAASRAVPCDPYKIEEFDYSGLDPAFAKLPKPAQRGLINNRIFKPKDLARYTLKEVLAFHGIGPSAAPTLRKHVKKG